MRNPRGRPLVDHCVEDDPGAQWRGYKAPEDLLVLLPAELPEGWETATVRLARVLVDAIAAGVFRQGKRLPRHSALARRYQVSEYVVTMAIADLAQRGIVRKGPGGRAYVTSAPGLT